ncbi:DNA mismatch repair endonuclease MutL [Vibrio sp. Of7-15]|uniref:DNA mismatch repair endonuclease MutL n=1 Tax=Vibrio sp. Of7-15 TaxID=2724879 RepID=UPI001EF3A63B|nr:DNA mismatch repair endonuclease MutL [Vibrio sp. Of7-15]MCG7498768.1 DNA mismatch repair endonuclease MutL [Vibrio sp. Of7-15]
MTIQILPARLANQIAAGEVVERPASVVKELVENSLDAGATRIDIDIEKGGSKMIRIRDNGKGIVKEELGLALSRHATSKIHTLDDLEAIVSLGFRGEALASISSVSRLTITSRTVAQEQAWSAYAEGRDMAVKTKPAAHPVGTTVEVLDLFFNTPARRKFLRTEKTEFGHIDELLKRIALSRFDVAINLRHNGKVIRQYRASQTDAQRERRLAAVCGQGFVQHALSVKLEYGDLTLSGWISSPEGARSQGDLQYCYVNGRMMRDKLINHAIRQGYESSLRPEQFAGYALFIEIDPHQVDVNVHPAKHEVRFHQARLVHDFIYQAISDSLKQSAQLPHVENLSESENESLENEKGSVSKTVESPASLQEKPAPSPVMEAIANSPVYPNKAEPREWIQSAPNPSRGTSYKSSHSNTTTRPGHNSARPPSSYGNSNYERPRPPSAKEVKNYQKLMQTPDYGVAEKGVAEKATDITPLPERAPVGMVPSAPEQGSIKSLGKALTVIQNQYLLMASGDEVQLLSLRHAQYLQILGQLNTAVEGELKAQPLLIPHTLPIAQEQMETLNQNYNLLAKLGIQLKPKGHDAVIVMAVSQPLRQQNLQQLVPNLLSYLDKQESDCGIVNIIPWLAQQLTHDVSEYTTAQAIQLVSELEQLWGEQLSAYHAQLLQPVDTIAAIKAFNHD